MVEPRENDIEVGKNGPTASTSPTRTLLVLIGLALLVNYVETMIIPGVPIIQKDFGTTATIASWITTAFLIVGAVSSADLSINHSLHFVYNDSSRRRPGTASLEAEPGATSRIRSRRLAGTM